ncbi:CotH kinase family protein, partial [bacterium]|nr:CotH kinase family protein [bacterium]
NFVNYNIPLTLFKGGINEGETNVLAIHGLNYPSTSSDALFLPELSASFSSGYITNRIAYFFTPTPAAANNAGISNLPPIISFAGHSPLVPEDFEEITVTARITETTLPIGNVYLHYRVMYGSENVVSMTDIGDGIYSGNISSAISLPGNMVRYYITASDTSGSTFRWPLFAIPTDTEYFGTVINNPLINTNVPVYHWFVLNTGAADTRAGTRCSFFYNDEFYDNIFCRLRGGSSSYQTKKPYKFEFNADHEFKFSEKYKRADEINVLAAYNDTSYMRDFLSWEILKDSSLPYCFAEIIQMRQNGVFFGLEVCVEQIDGHFLRRQNINDNGSLYKSPHPGTLIELSTIGNLEKKRPKDGDYSDMTNFINGLHLSTEAQIKTYMLDNVNIPEVVNYLAAHRIFMEFDFGVKNYYLYNDSEERGEWTIYAWDKDLTFGMIWTGTNVFGDEEHGPAGWGVASMYWCEANYLYRRIIGTFRNMYARRIRTLMDKLLQPPDTPRENLKFENRVYELHGKIKALADIDRAKWGWPTQSDFYNRTDHLDIDGGCNELTNDFFAQRRKYMYITRSVDNGGMIPHSQPETADLIFGNIEIFPSSGIKDEEYFELINTNNFAVDISNWQISNAVTFSFFGGTVVPAGETVYVSPSVKIFRGRTISPKSGENNFVAGNYSGQLDANGETIFLLNCEGEVIASANTIPEPGIIWIVIVLAALFSKGIMKKFISLFQG